MVPDFYRGDSRREIRTYEVDPQIIDADIRLHLCQYSRRRSSRHPASTLRLAIKRPHLGLLDK